MMTTLGLAALPYASVFKFARLHDRNASHMAFHIIMYVPIFDISANCLRDVTTLCLNLELTDTTQTWQFGSSERPQADIEAQLSLVKK